MELVIQAFPPFGHDGIEGPLIKQYLFQKNYAKFFPQRQVMDSKRNVLFCLNRKHCFSMAKREGDVFYFAVSHPLSIFQGFCIALSEFHEIKVSDGL
jgi:hypothetical protein